MSNKRPADNFCAIRSRTFRFDVLQFAYAFVGRTSTLPRPKIRFGKFKGRRARTIAGTTADLFRKTTDFEYVTGGFFFFFGFGLRGFVFLIIIYAYFIFSPKFRRLLFPFGRETKNEIRRRNRSFVFLSPSTRRVERRSRSTREKTFFPFSFLREIIFRQQKLR